SWQVFAQWHQQTGSGPPPVRFYVNGETVRLDVGPDGTNVWTGTLYRGVWYDFVFHVKWSPDPTVGYVELYVDDGSGGGLKLVTPRRAAQTQFAGTGNTNYLKVGLYRDVSIKPAGIVYHDGWVQGHDKADVMPPPRSAIARE
ncbi:MAG TPA: heparin lyase I family protein, partial [Burkholderiaceae bacterium]